MQSDTPLTRELVLAGGGHAHALVLRRWGMKPLPGVRVTVINPGPTAPYTGMLPGHAAGHYGRDELEIDLVRLAHFAGARLILGRVCGIDQDTRRVWIEGRGSIGYDVLSLDVGITSEMPALPGFAEHGTPAKPLDHFARNWRAWLDEARSGSGPARVAVIGAGIGGVELALAMGHALGQIGRSPEITVIDEADALDNIGQGARKALLQRMQEAGITLKPHSRAASVDAGGVTLEDGSRIEAGFVLGAAGARPQDWLASTGLPLTKGFVDVDATLRSTGAAAIFAAGDCAHMTHAPRPKAGVYAVRAAPVLFDNLRASLTGERLRAYFPQRDYLKLVSLGGKSALADKFGLRLEGPWLWRLKDRIDRKFMDKLTHLPAMEPPPVPAEAALGLREMLEGRPLCSGCGAKVGGAGLRAALAEVPQPVRDDVRARPGDDAAEIVVDGARLVMTHDHLRAVTPDPWLMARIAAVHALGDIWAMGARPQAALASVILPRLSEDLQAGWLREVMEGATRVFAAEGAAIAGGHTTMGSELTIGFTITGRPGRRIIGLEGARPGDALVLTKPLGSGTILAGAMQNLASGRDVAALWPQMLRPMGRDAAALSEARAMTDVTGFGLAGHLGNMLEASRAGAELELESIPVLEGAGALARAGVRSSLYEANRAAAPVEGVSTSPIEALLFDPQTCGGLLAAVPPEALEAAMTALAGAGAPAAVIGRVIPGPVRITLA